MAYTECPSRYWSAAAFIALALLAGCETAPLVSPTLTGPAAAAAWEMRQAELAKLARWTAVGRIGVRSEEESWSASIVWEQDGDSFRIRLSGPLGQGLVQVAGRPGHVELRTSAKEVHTAADVDDLLRIHTGFKVPISILRHWLLGRAGPASKVDQLVLDRAGRLQTLRQAGWKLEIERYGGPAALTLPTKLNVSNETISARMVVRQWRVES